jgi:hypothetical protein
MPVPGSVWGRAFLTLGDNPSPVDTRLVLLANSASRLAPSPCLEDPLMKTLAALVAVILAFLTAVAYYLVWSGQ